MEEQPAEIVAETQKLPDSGLKLPESKLNPKSPKYLLQQLRKSRNFSYQLRKILNERNTAMISAICKEWTKDEIVEFLDLAIRRNCESEVKRPWGSCFIRTIKDHLRDKGDTEAVRRVFGKTSEQKRKKDVGKRNKHKLEKKGIESVGKSDPLKNALQEQIEAIQNNQLLKLQEANIP